MKLISALATAFILIGVIILFGIIVNSCVVTLHKGLDKSLKEIKESEKCINGVIRKLSDNKQFYIITDGKCVEMKGEIK